MDGFSRAHITGNRLFCQMMGSWVIPQRDDTADSPRLAQVHPNAEARFFPILPKFERFLGVWVILEPKNWQTKPGLIPLWSWECPHFFTHLWAIGFCKGHVLSATQFTVTKHQPSKGAALKHIEVDRIINIPIFYESGIPTLGSNDLFIGHIQSSFPQSAEMLPIVTCLGWNFCWRWSQYDVDDD